MSQEPLVCAVCVTANRPDMLARAIRCFDAQTYPRKCMYILDTSRPTTPYLTTGSNDSIITYDSITHWISTGGPNIGELRNRAIAWTGGDIIVHFDDDDWSCPNRIQEQVDLLRATGADAVGYNDCLFWQIGAGYELSEGEFSGKAWLYRAGKRNYAVGTSLCYWRRTWERNPFPAVTHGEDTQWQHKVFPHVVSSLFPPREWRFICGTIYPRIIATIHGQNTSMNAYGPLLTGCSEQFVRVPEWDDYCRGVIEGREVAV